MFYTKSVDSKIVVIPGSTTAIKSDAFINSSVAGAAFMKTSIQFPTIPNGEFFIEKKLVVELLLTTKYWDVENRPIFEEDEEEEEEKPKKGKKAKKDNDEDEDNDGEVSSEEDDEDFDEEAVEIMAVLTVPLGDFEGPASVIPLAESEEYNRLDEDDKTTVGKRTKFFDRHLQMLAGLETLRAQGSSASDEENSALTEEDLPSSNNAAAISEIIAKIEADKEKQVERITILEGLLKTGNEQIEMNENAYELVQDLLNLGLINESMSKDITQIIDNGMSKIKKDLS